MIDKTIVKMGMALAIMITLIGFWQWDRNRAYQGGYDAAKAEELERFAEAEEQAKTDLDAAKTDRNHWKQVAIDLQKRPKEKVYIYVPKIVENNPDCTAINGFSELWNAARKNYSGTGGN